MPITVNAQTEAVDVESVVKELSNIDIQIYDLITILKTKRLVGTINIPVPKKRVKKNRFRRKKSSTRMPPVVVPQAKKISTDKDVPSPKSSGTKVKPSFTQQGD